MTCSYNDFFFKAKIGQKKECEYALQHLRGHSVDISQVAFETRVTFRLQTSMRK